MPQRSNLFKSHWSTNGLSKHGIIVQRVVEFPNLLRVVIAANSGRSELKCESTHFHFYNTNVFG